MLENHRLLIASLDTFNLFGVEKPMVILVELEVIQENKPSILSLSCRFNQQNWWPVTNG